MISSGETSFSWRRTPQPYGRRKPARGSTVRDGRGGRVDNLIDLNVAPQLHRLLLGFFFLAADIRDDVVENIGIRFKGFAGAGDGLICAGEHLRDARSISGE